MTRINLVPPGELCDQHLIAEYHELPRVRYMTTVHIPAHFRLGLGHLKFFADKGTWLQKRYKALAEEMGRRGFEVRYPVLNLGWQEERMKDWEPRDVDIQVSRSRIQQRLQNMTPRYTRSKENGDERA